MFETAVGPGELLTEIRVPKLGDSTGWSYVKYHRRAQDWATVGVAALVHRDNGIRGRCVGRARRTWAGRRCGRGGWRMRSRAARRRVAAAAHAAEGTEPSSDTAASAEFRMHLARVLTERALIEAMA